MLKRAENCLPFEGSLAFQVFSNVLPRMRHSLCLLVTVNTEAVYVLVEGQRFDDGEFSSA